MASRPRRAAAVRAVANIWGENEESSDSVSGENSSDSEIEAADIDVIHDEQEDSMSDSQEEEEEEDPAQFIDKNGNIWKQEEGAQVGRRNAANIIRESAGPTQAAFKDSIVETWQIFFPDSLLQKIVDYTNSYARSIDNTVSFDLISFKAFIALLYWRGANHDQAIPADDLWCEDGSPFYSSVMSRSKFKQWLRFLRFDDRDTREQRIVTDTFAAISEIWNEWNERLPQYFKASHCVTVDEQLVSSRTRSPHKVYNPSKPGKYGELIRWCADSQHRYVFRGSPWTKRPTDPVAKESHIANNKATALVLDLVKPFYSTGRNVTGDRFFTSLPLSKELLSKRLTYIGTMMSNKRDIPPILHERQEVEQSEFVFSEDNKVTLAVYQAAPTKKVYMLSTMHHKKEVHPENKAKTEIQMEYNRTKAGVDTVDQMARKYSVRFSTRRWPVVHFQNLLDITAINTETIFNFTHPNWISQREKHRRRIFLLRLARELALSHIIMRLQNPTGLHSTVKHQMKRYANQPAGTSDRQCDRNSDERPANTTVLRCKKCKDSGKSARQANKTNKKCHLCDSPCCSSHASAILCADCV